MKKLAALALLAAALTALPADGAVASKRRPVLLLMHPGGFMFGDASFERPAAERARKRGFQTRNIAYLLGNAPGAYRQVVRIARRYDRAGRRVYAYGESAGGTLAALLAERGLARAAATYSPVPDILHWATEEQLPYIGLTRETAPRYSPALHESRRPILALVPRRDDPVRIEDTRRWAKHDPRVVARDIPGRHSFKGSKEYLGNLRVAMRWLTRKAR